MAEIRDDLYQEDVPYEFTDLVAPVLKGTPFHLFYSSCKLSKMIQYKLMNDSKAFVLRERENQAIFASIGPKYQPIYEVTTKMQQPYNGTNRLKTLAKELSVVHGAYTAYKSCLDFHHAYMAKETTPLEVAKKLLEEFENSPVNSMAQWDTQNVLEQAKESTKRYEKGMPLSCLDGVPTVVKDELDVIGFSTTCGTSFLADEVPCATRDATVVGRLRSNGMIIMGKSVMHEIGIGTHGQSNIKWGTAKNPYNQKHYCGGSSSGTAAAVASGFCPFGLGSDGGGSVRLPAAHCGLYGLKATYGRLSGEGASHLAPSVGHHGPLAATTSDLLLSYAILSGPDENCKESLYQPTPKIKSIWRTTPDQAQLKQFLKGKRIGVFPEYFNDTPYGQKSSLSPIEVEYRKKCWNIVKQMEANGAEIVRIPIPHLLLYKTAHLITILTEMSSFMRPYLSDYRSSMLTSTQFALLIASNYNGADFVQSQAVRAHAMKECEKIFEKCDLFVTPTSAIPAPKMPSISSNRDFSNVAETSKQMKYMFLGNLTGIPGLTVPVGYTEQGHLPIGLQFQAKWWNEEVLLGIAQASEFLLNNDREIPSYSIELL